MGFPVEFVLSLIHWIQYLEFMYRVFSLINFCPYYSMERIIERYERHSYVERQHVPTDSESQVCLAANYEIYPKMYIVTVNHVFCCKCTLQQAIMYIVASNCQAKVCMLWFYYRMYIHCITHNACTLNVFGYINKEKLCLDIMEEKESTSTWGRFGGKLNPLKPSLF